MIAADEGDSEIGVGPGSDCPGEVGSSEITPLRYHMKRHHKQI